MHNFNCYFFVDLSLSHLGRTCENKNNVAKSNVTTFLNDSNYKYILINHIQKCYDDNVLI